MNPYGLVCGGLLLLITIAEKEVRRKTEVDKMLKYMYQQFEELEILEELPKDLKRCEFIFTRAMDIRSAFMDYLAINIRHKATTLGVVGKISLLNLINCIRKSVEELACRG